jgi:hypothetical protein
VEIHGGERETNWIHQGLREGNEIYVRTEERRKLVFTDAESFPRIRLRQLFSCGGPCRFVFHWYLVSSRTGRLL